MTEPFQPEKVYCTVASLNVWIAAGYSVLVDKIQPGPEGGLVDGIALKKNIIASEVRRAVNGR